MYLQLGHQLGHLGQPGSHQMFSGIRQAKLEIFSYPLALIHIFWHGFGQCHDFGFPPNPEEGGLKPQAPTRQQSCPTRQSIALLTKRPCMSFSLNVHASTHSSCRQRGFVGQRTSKKSDSRSEGVQWSLSPSTTIEKYNKGWNGMDAEGDSEQNV